MDWLSNLCGKTVLTFHHQLIRDIDILYLVFSFMQSGVSDSSTTESSLLVFILNS